MNGHSVQRFVEVKGHFVKFQKTEGNPPRKASMALSSGGGRHHLLATVDPVHPGRHHRAAELATSQQLARTAAATPQ